MRRKSHHFQTAEPGENKTTGETKTTGEGETTELPLETTELPLETTELPLLDDKSKEAKEELNRIMIDVYEQGAKRGRKPLWVLGNFGGKIERGEGGTLTFVGGTDLGPYISVKKAAAAIGATSVAIYSTIKNNKTPSTNKKGYSDCKGSNYKARIMFIQPDPSTLGRHITAFNKLREIYSIVSKRVLSSMVTDRDRYNEGKLSKIAMTELDLIKDAKISLKYQHVLTYQICVHMIEKGMFASKNVIDDNNGFIDNGFNFHQNGGLFALSLDRIEDNYMVIDQQFYRPHFRGVPLLPNLTEARENINCVALMANVAKKASKVERKRHRDQFEKKSVEQRQNEFKEILVKALSTTYNPGDKSRGPTSTPLYAHANTMFGPNPRYRKEIETVKISFGIGIEEEREEKEERKEAKQEAVETATILKKKEKEKKELEAKVNRKKKEKEKEKEKKELEAKVNRNKIPIENMGGLEERVQEEKQETKKVKRRKKKKQQEYNRPFHVYWKYLQKLLEEQKGLCAVGRYPMTIEKGPWMMSVDAINPKLHHVKGNLRLVCVCNNPSDSSKNNLNPDELVATTQTPEIHDTYWYTTNCKDN